MKRNGQYYINVNHYTIAIKCTGLLRGKGFSEMAYLVSKNDSDMIDALVIDSDWCEQSFDKALVYEGTYLKTGARDAMSFMEIEARKKINFMKSTIFLKMQKLLCLHRHFEKEQKWRSKCIF